MMHGAFHRPAWIAVILGFAGALMLACIPLAYLLFAVVPHDLRMEVLADAPVSIRVDEVGESTEAKFSVQLSVVRDFATVQLYREFLPPDVDARRLSCTFDCSLRKCIELKRIRFVVADLLAWDVTAGDLRRFYEMSDGVSVEDGVGGAIIVNLKNGTGTLTPRNGFAPCGNWVGLRPTGLILPSRAVPLICLFITSLFALSLFCTSINRRRGNKKYTLLNSVALALFVSVFLMLVLPLQSFWSNRMDYAFTALELFSSQILPTLVTSMAIAACLYCASYSFGCLFHIVLLAFLVYEYLQTGILSIGAPALNGDMSYYTNHALAVRDIAIMAIIIGASLLAARWIYRHFLVIVGIFFIVVLAATVDSALGARSGNETTVTTSDTGFCSKLDVLKNLEFSKRNVIVLVLDSVSTEVASDVLRNSPEIAENFKGFTVFENNIGMHHETDFATVGMLTGDYFTNRLTDASVKTAYLKKAFGDKSVLSHYAEMGASVYFMPSAFDFGLMRDGSVRRLPDLEDHWRTNRNCRRPVNRRKEDAFSFSLRDMTLFRLSPFAAKNAAFDLLYASASGHGRVEDEESVYAILKGRKVIDDDRTTFAFVHTHGAHCPHDITRDGHKLTDGVNDGYDRYYDHVYFVLHHVGSLLDSWRGNGVLDKSYVVLAADHGSHANNDTRIDIRKCSNLPPRAHPMLCIKPFSASGALAYDVVSSTHHARLCEVLNSLKERDLSLAETTKLLSARIACSLFLMKTACRIGM